MALNNWKLEPQIVYKELVLKKKTISIQEAASFLLSSEKELKELNFSKIGWNHDSGCDEEYGKYSEEETLSVSGSRPMTDLEQSEYEIAQRLHIIKRTRDNINWLKPALVKEEVEKQRLSENLERFERELPNDPRRKSNIKDVKKSLKSRIEIIAALKDRITNEVPLLDLDDETLVFEYRKLKA